jgi:hypothetical protein
MIPGQFQGHLSFLPPTYIIHSRAVYDMQEYVRNMIARHWQPARNPVSAFLEFRAVLHNFKPGGGSSM